jgi:glycosyltransferase involved in cell wall biosynthesis
MAPRICFVTQSVYGYFRPEYGFTGGGAERQVYFLSRALAETFDVHIIVTDHGQPQREEIDGVTLHRSYPSQPRQNIFQPVKHFFVLLRAMARVDADLYIYRNRPRRAWVVYLVAKLLRSEWVYNIGNDANIRQRPARLSRPVQRFYARSLHDAAGIITQTDHQRQLLEETYGVDATVVPNGYPTADDPVDHTNRDYFLWVGTIDENQKRPHLYLDLADELPDQQFRLVGPIENSPYHERIDDRASTLDNVTLAGEKGAREIHDEYRDAIALVNTSAYEGFPNTFLEAWRQATPVLTLGLDPTRYLSTGAVYADGDWEQFRAAAERLGTDSQYRQQLGESGRNAFESSLKISTVADQYATALSEALE